MAIESEYLPYYERIGLALTPEDYDMGDGNSRTIYVSLDFDMIYSTYDEKKPMFPISIKGHEWSALWWMYRLSERNCKFEEYFSEYIIPICRRYFIEERKRLAQKQEDEDDDNRGT